MPIDNKLHAALTKYYGTAGKFKINSFIAPKILEQITEIGKEEYYKIHKEHFGEFDLSEMSTIIELPLNENDVENYNLFIDTLYNIAEMLFEEKRQRIKIGKIFKIAGCNSVPVKVTLEVAQRPTAMFIKRSPLEENPRPLGIELFSLIGGFENRYQYFFDTDVVVEALIPGVHLPHVSEKKRLSSIFAKGRIALDLMIMYCGIQDTKVDNYLVVEEDCSHIIIDFELFGITSWDEGFYFVKEATVKKLGISPIDYDNIFEHLEQNLAFRLSKKRKKLKRLLHVFKGTGKPDLIALATDIEDKTTRLIESYLK